MSAVSFEVAVILLLVLVNGLFAMAETALVSARRARLQALADRGDRGARAALDLAHDPNALLSTVQVGITLVGVLAGAFGGATVAEALAAELARVPAVAPWAGPIALGAVVVGITYLSLIFGELVPKRLALGWPERIAAAVARPFRVLARASGPVVWFLSASTDGVLRLLRLRPPKEQGVTEEEVRVLVEQGARAGTFAAAEHQMIESVLRLGDRRVGSIMTPRTEIEWLDANAPPEEHARRVAESQHERFVVADGDLEHVLGIVRTKDLLKQALAGRPIDVRAALVKPIFVPDTAPALRLLEEFKTARPHVALVIDEYGGLEGIVTMGDILESIVGDLPDVGEAAGPRAVRRDDGSWLIDAWIGMDEVRSLLRLGPAPSEPEPFGTLAGFVLFRLGRIPTEGDRFEWGGLSFEVIDMDGRRVDKVLVRALPGTTGERT